MRRVSGCTLSTLYFVNSGEVASDEMLLITLLLMTLLLMTCLQERFLQTRFYRRISSDAILSDAILSDALSFKCLAYPIDNFSYLVIIKTQEVILRNTLCSNISLALGDRLGVSLAIVKRLPSAKDSFLSSDARTSKAFSNRGLRVERLHSLAT